MLRKRDQDAIANVGADSWSGVNRILLRAVDRMRYAVQTNFTLKSIEPFWGVWKS
jgi:hypothetical protein